MGIFTDRFRYIILAVGFLGLVSLSSNPMAYNIAIICMKKDVSSNITLEDGTEKMRFDFNKKEEVIIYWSLAAGTILGSLPSNFIYIRWGARWPFFISGLISAIATAAIPIVIYWNFWLFILCRFIQGVGYSADFAAVGILCVRWASLKQYAVFIGVLMSFSPISITLTNAVSGVACGLPTGWQTIWYMHAGFGIIAFVLWIWVYSDDPQNTPRVSAVELEKINRGKTKEHIERDSFVPYWEIMKNPVVLLVWLNAFCELSCYVALSTYLPLYYSAIYGMSTATTGLITALTQVGHLPVKIFAGLLSDRVKSLSEVTKLCIGNTIAVGGCGLCIAGIAFTPQSMPVLSVAMAIAFFLACGVNCAGFYKAGTLVCRQYSHFVLSNMQFTKCIALIVIPLLKVVYVGEANDYWPSWRNFWVTQAVVLIVVNFVFYFVVTDQPAEFTKITRETVRQQREEKLAAKKGIETIKV